MKTVTLTEEEAEYLSGKTFWDWKRAEVDVMALKAPWFKDDEARVEADKTERFFRNLYNKLDGNDE